MDNINHQQQNQKYQQHYEDQFPFQIGEHIDCQDTYNKWLNAEIVAIRDDNEIKVHYTGWGSKWDEWLPINSERILKQWKRNNKIQLNNRLDVKEVIVGLNQWMEAKVIKINEQNLKIITIHYIGYHSKYDRELHLDENSDIVAEVGSHSSAGGQASLSTDQNRTEKYNGFIQQILKKEQIFKEELKQRQMIIKPVDGDGNCLFRAISDQMYGTEQFHNHIRQVCMDYIEIEKHFFKNYIVSGEYGFKLYVEMKRKEGIWGDDVEIQALSEIYNRPVELYGYSLEPMRTFHETNKKNIEPMRLSYHGQCHYNSVKAIGSEDIGFIQNDFGVLETQVLEQGRERALQRQQILQQIMNQQQEQGNSQQNIQQNILESAITLSRKEFEEVGKRNMEQALEESLQQVYQDNKKLNKDDQKAEDPDKDFQDLLKKVIDDSGKDYQKIQDKEAEDQILEDIRRKSEEEYIQKRETVIREAQNYGINIDIENARQTYQNGGRTVKEIIQAHYEMMETIQEATKKAWDMNLFLDDNVAKKVYLNYKNATDILFYCIEKQLI